MLPADEANRRYFRESYRTGKHGWEIEEPSRCALAFLKQVRRQVQAGTLLDIGCGEGRHCFAAWHLGFEVTGIDYEPMALERARHFALTKHAEDITLCKANVFSLPFPRSSFDVVLDYGCLHHQRKSDWTAYAASILRVLKPFSFYILSVFSPKFHFFRAHRRPWHIAYGAYRRCFTQQEISVLFGRQFEILAIEEVKGEGRGFWHVLMKRRSEGGAKQNDTRHN